MWVNYLGTKIPTIYIPEEIKVSPKTKEIINSVNEDRLKSIEENRRAAEGQRLADEEKARILAEEIKNWSDLDNINCLDEVSSNTAIFSINWWDLYTCDTNVTIDITEITADTSVKWWYISENSSEPAFWNFTKTKPTSTNISSWDWVKTLNLFVQYTDWSIKLVWTKTIIIDTITPNTPKLTKWEIDGYNYVYKERKINLNIWPSWISYLNIKSEFWIISNVSVSWWIITFDYISTNIPFWIWKIYNDKSDVFTQGLGYRYIDWNNSIEIQWCSGSWVRFNIISDISKLK